MNEEQRAQRLAEWLQSPEGTEPPADLDPDVLATVFALRPDRAPAPRLSLDDILSGVKEGPFATPTSTPDNVVEFPRPAVRVAAAETRAAPRKKRPSRFWFGPALGVGFAFAAAALISFPMVANLSKRDLTPEASWTPAPAAAPATPAEESRAIAEVQGAPTGGAMQEAPVSGADAPAPPPADTLAARKDADLAPARDVATRGDGAAFGAEAQPAAAPTASGLRVSASGAGAAVTAPATVTTATSAVSAAPAKASSYEESPAEPEGVANGPSTLWDGRPLEKSPVAEMEDATAPVADDWRGNDDEVVAKEDKKAEAAKTRSKAPAASAPAANALSKAAPPSPAVATEARRERSAALDYSSSWYQSDPTVSALYAPALAEEAAGRWAQAAALWQGLVSNARTDIAQDAALRAGKAWRTAGRVAEALAVVDAGLRRSSANTAVRSSLLVLRGELLAAQGRAAESKKAMDQAGELDADR